MPAGGVVFVRVAAVIGDLFHVDPASITADTFSQDIAGWDSLSYTMLLLRLEDEFSVDIPPEKAWQLNNVGELAALIAAEQRS